MWKMRAGIKIAQLKLNAQNWSRYRGNARCELLDRRSARQTYGKDKIVRKIENT